MGLVMSNFDQELQVLNAISDDIRERLTAMNSARDTAISQSRELIRRCAECIRAIHRHEWEQADLKKAIIQSATDDLKNTVANYPELYHSGYTQDALKEVVEAFCTASIIRHQPLPQPAVLGVEASTYLLGLAEAATELRRFILDIMRRSEHHSDEAEYLLAWMDTIYDLLVTFDFPDALTHGLRRQTDIVRGVLERTRGDLTNSLRQQMLQDALMRFEQKVTGDQADG